VKEKKIVLGNFYSLAPPRLQFLRGSSTAPTPAPFFFTQWLTRVGSNFDSVAPLVHFFPRGFPVYMMDTREYIGGDVVNYSSRAAT
jgi:hypothetical protein